MAPGVGLMSVTAPLLEKTTAAPRSAAAIQFLLGGIVFIFLFVAKTAKELPPSHSPHFREALVWECLAVLVNLSPRQGTFKIEGFHGTTLKLVKTSRFLAQDLCLSPSA
jgi:hypothetical protein